MSEYDEMRERQASEAAEKRRAADALRADDLIAGGKRMIEREWRALGREPVYNADGSLTAPSTLKLIGGWPPRPKPKPPEEPPGDVEIEF